MVVLGELGHGEGPGNRHLDSPRGDAAEEPRVAREDRTGASDGPHHPGHLLRLAATIDRRPGPVEVEAVERGGELIEVAFAALLSIGHDVDASPLHVAHGEADRVVLRLLQVGLGDAPHLAHADARDDVRRQGVVIEQPARLRIAADDGGRQHGRGVPPFRSASRQGRAARCPGSSPGAARDDTWCRRRAARDAWWRGCPR